MVLQMVYHGVVLAMQYIHGSVFAYEPLAGSLLQITTSMEMEAIEMMSKYTYY